jgi:phosphatidylserine/phosphatidylglycerophosphate/cardiolipin synthase-like enzyme
MTRLTALSLCMATLLPLTACAPTDHGDVEDGEFDMAGGKADSITEGSAQAGAILALVNDPAVDKDELDYDAGLSSRAAGNIIAARPFATLAALDAVAYVGEATLNQLLTYATAQGYVGNAPKIDVVFSPQPAGQTHAARIAAMIRAATTSVDVAMYSFSDAEIATALTEAVARGVKVRFLFETARTDKNISDLAARTASKSGKLEKTNVDVRWVNKILHHKFVIVDGPRDDAGKAATAKIATGSANWSFGGSSIYDENTLFVEGYQEVAQAYQREFDLCGRARATSRWRPADRARVLDDRVPDADRRRRRAGAVHQRQLHPTHGRLHHVPRRQVQDPGRRRVGQGHQRSDHVDPDRARPRAAAAGGAGPDRQEAGQPEHQHPGAASTSRSSSRSPPTTRSGPSSKTCLEEAGADVTAQRECTENDFLYGRMIGLAGIDVRYKSYAYRWDATYAVQMHNKYMIVDGDELFTGSYNWSMNAEHGTFENVLHLTGAANAGVIDKFEANFGQMWNLNTSNGTLTSLRSTISTAQTIPMLFTPMALTWQQLNDLKTLIRANCTQADSTDFRTNPAAHKTCQRQ